MVRPDGLCQRKIPMKQSSIEPATFRLVAQCLNKLRHRVPHTNKQVQQKTTKLNLEITLASTAFDFERYDRNELHNTH